MPKATPKEKETLTCPECGKTGFRDKRWLGVHRRSIHGVKGSSPSVLALRRREQQAAREAKSAPAVARAVKKAVAVEKPAQTGLIVKSAAIPEISLAMLGYAMGRLESLAEQIARENGLPEKEFAKLAAGHLAELLKR